MIGPAPMMRMLLMSVRLGMSYFFAWSIRPVNRSNR
jgi:hypothetical protein